MKNTAVNQIDSTKAQGQDCAPEPSGGGHGSMELSDVAGNEREVSQPFSRERIGEVLPAYRRFDQRYAMFDRPYWDPQIKPLKVFYDGFRMDKANIKGGGHSQESFALRNAGWHVSLVASQAGDYAGHVDPFNWGRKGSSKKTEINDPAKMAHRIKRAAMLLGASRVGIAKVDMRWVYSQRFRRNTLQSEAIEIPQEFKYAIVIITEMDYETVHTYPSALGGAASGLGYSKEAFVSTSLAQFISNLGYQAIASMNDTALGIPMAIDAGLGQLGRNGILITPWFGPRVRISKVFTDIPLSIDRPLDFGVSRFCEVCKKCVDDCPSRAISGDAPTAEGPTKSNNGGVVKWYVNAEKCFEFWARNGSECGNCIRVCPWNKDFSHRLHRMTFHVIKNVPALNRAIVFMDDLFGYGKRMSPEKWWDKQIGD
jgi:epoxyqueuosine reductase